MSNKYTQKELINDVLKSNWKEKNFHPQKRVQSLRIASLNRRNIHEFSTCIIKMKDGTEHIVENGNIVVVQDAHTKMVYEGEILNENLESTGIEIMKISRIHLRHNINGIDVFYNIENGEWDYELDTATPIQLSLW